MTEYYWEPPQTATRSTIIADFDRKADYRTLQMGKVIGDQAIGQAQACIRIERFVCRVVSTQLPAYEFRLDCNNTAYSFRETSLGTQLREAISLLGFFDSGHDYSEHLHAFLHACWLIESVYGTDLELVGNQTFSPDDHCAETMNNIVEKIRMCSRESWFQRSVSDRRWEASTKARKIAKSMSDTLLYYARTMVVRTDLSYLESVADTLTIDKVYEHLDHLLRLKSWHPVFQSLVGYAWTLEQGERQGFHIHTAFFFDGSKECRDGYKGIEIKELWVNEITYGSGKAHICNLNKNDYDIGKIGIGVIDRMDSQSCENAIEHIQYMTKDSQYLRIKPKGRRVFGVGAAPTRDSKRGRPPLQEPTWSCSQYD